MIIPLMVVLFLTVIDLGLLLREHQLLENAAREGVRLSALTENRIDTSEDPATTKSRIQQRVVEYLSNEEITIDLGDVNITQNQPIVVGAVTVTASEVIVTYDRSPLFLGAPLLPGGVFTLRGRAVFRNLY